MTITGNFIGGKTVISSSNETMPVYDPATGKAVREVTVSTAQEVSEAIQVARDAFDSWSRTTPLRRARVLFNFKMLLEQHVEELAGIIVSEHGKVWSDALGELTRGMEVVEFACGIPHLIKGEYSSDVGTGVDSYSLMQPLGVVAGITPFNFPAMVPMWMFPLALACGNSFVLKPPALAPTAAVRLAELLKEAGLPDGVFNVVHCSNEDAEQLYTDPRIAAVSFVGSSGVAEYIYKPASAHGKRVQAFGAAKNHAIVMPDADLDATVNAIMGGAFGSAGERCMALPVVVAGGDENADKLI
ncbi:aldehyde dehydrogenase family protein, partial [Klebsiella pneumoniae]|uniref:aldehyde dehydrogenase family protein n=1 Tax=Klebsiella pneumoniae TaxID=573 RepID=UPI000CC3A7D2